MARIFDTPPLSIIDLLADQDHYTPGRGGFEPFLIIIHHSGGTWSGPWLSTTKGSGVSTHRLISKAGVIRKIVADEDTAWTAGFGTVGPVDPDGNDPPGVARNLNQITLNIEFENLGTGQDPYPAAQLNAGAKQVVEWWGKYGLIGILGHGQVDARKNDPLGFPWEDFFRRIDRAYLAVRQGVV